MSGQKVFLGIDLGAESGRVMAAIWKGKQVRLEELHRFPNGAVQVADTYRWDVLRLWQEIQSGLTAGAKKFGNDIVSVGVDTWGVDYVLLSKNGEMLGQPYQYRDARTRGLMAEAFNRVPRADIFAQTGLQFMEINTLYQLLATRKNTPELLESADCLLMIPDFLNWCLCGTKVVEFTNATTTQCVHPLTRNWSYDLLKQFCLPTNIFPEIVQPGTKVGPIRASVADRTGLNRIEVVAPATHDTGSAVVGVPTINTGKSNWAYLSSGTWSLMGVELQNAQLSRRTLELNLTNEGGIDGTYRLLKNIMGLWIVQNCKRAFESRGKNYDYPQLVKLAEAATPLRSIVNPDDARFLNPADMPGAIQQFCRETSQPVPETEGEIVRCAFESLALKYKVVFQWLEELAGNRIEVIHIVGGGSRNQLLNQFTANACGRPVIAGPAESTVLGNVLVQLRAAGEVQSLHDMRTILKDSSELSTFEPKNEAAWSEAYERTRHLLV